MVAVPTPRTWADDDALDSTNLNTGIKDVLAFLLVRPHALVRQTVAQTLTTGVGAGVTFGTEDVDTDVDGTGGHDNSTNPSRYTARYPGWYRTGGGTAFAANATGRRGNWWSVNGSRVAGSIAMVAATAANEAAVPARVIEVYLNAGDYLELVAYHERGSNLDTLIASGWESTMDVIWVAN